MPPPDPIRQLVFARANHCCEYCLTQRRLIGMSLVVDHIIPQILGGSDASENLCACCYRCNEFKGPRIVGRDPLTNELAPLFNPRTQRWLEHFLWENGGTHIIGRTPTGRATVLALRLNNDYIVESRSLWITYDLHPPKATLG